MKRFFTLLFVGARNSRLVTLLLAFFLLVPGVSWGQDRKYSPEAGAWYNIIDDEYISIYRAENPPSEVVIPEEIDGYPVKFIEAYAYQDLEITSVQIPSSVTRIESSAFENTSISEVTIPASVTYLGASFGRCNNLKTVTFQYTGDLSEYDSDAFYGCYALQNIYVPKGMKEAYSTKYPNYADIIQEKEMTPSGISKVSSDTSNNQHSAAIYSIDGKLVSKDGNTTGIAKGIYIQNGKKLVIK